MDQHLTVNFTEGLSNYEYTKYTITEVVGACSASKSKELEVEERRITVSLIFRTLYHHASSSEIRS